MMESTVEAECKKMEIRGGKSHLRSSNLELFRIITMFLIVAHHYVVNSGLTAVGGPIYSDPLSWRSIFLLLFGAWGKTGINCFIFITGYFMCKSRITVKKYIKLLCEVMFYRIIIYSVFLISGYEAFSVKGLAKALLPITSVSTGFTGCYLLFFLFIPFINILIKHMTEKQHIKILLVFGLMYVILGTLPGINVTMNYVSWFTVLYLISAYVRMYPKKIFDSAKVWGWISLAMLVISSVSVLACTWLGTKIGRSMSFYFLSDSNKILAVAMAFSAFMFFKNINMKNSRFINAVAASAFGVLLIHANSDTMRRWLWGDILDNVGMYSSQWLVLHAVGSVIVIYAVCTAIDHLRIRLIETPLMRVWDKLEDKLREKYFKAEGKICKRFNISED